QHRPRSIEYGVRQSSCDRGPLPAPRRQVLLRRGPTVTEGLVHHGPRAPGIHTVGELARRHVREYALRIFPLPILLELVLELDPESASEDGQVVLDQHPVPLERTLGARAAVIDGGKRRRTTGRSRQETPIVRSWKRIGTPQTSLTVLAPVDPPRGLL